MFRKIIKQGHNTLTITLPSEWTRKLNLAAGSEINLIERENGLLITSEKKGDISHAEFDIEGMDIPTIWKYFMASIEKDMMRFWSNSLKT
jgi:antitoxin component of MazEF toxin-antitoxin module